MLTSISCRRTKTPVATFQRRSTNRPEERRRTMPENIGLYFCQECDKTFARPASLYQHVLIHHSVKPWKCDVCGRAFTYRCQLRSHFLKHDPNRPFTCHDCAASFKRISNLRKHIARFHDVREKHHRCEPCQRSFSSMSMLRHHIRVSHERVRSFKCSDCNAAFVENTT
jgi:KRAB domain-containing zinc finger protein